MKTTPKIPTAFIEQKDIEIKYKTKDGEEKSVFWRNAFSEELLGANVDRFYCTETLFGDWNGEVLLLAQDAMPAPVLKRDITAFKKIGIPASEAWVHADKDNPNRKYLDEDRRKSRGGFKTNKFLIENKEKYIGSRGVLYGSVSANMLFDNKGEEEFQQKDIVSGFNNSEAREYMLSVLEWVVTNMPNLKVIFCVGEMAWRVSSDFSNLKKKDRHHRDYNGEPPKSLRVEIGGREIDLISSYHPSGPTSADKVQRTKRSWEYLREFLNQ